MRFRQHSFQLSVHRRETAIVADLKYRLALLRGIQDASRIRDARRHRLFAEDVLAFFDRENRKFSVLRVGSGDVDRVAQRQYFGDAVRDLRAG